MPTLTGSMGGVWFQFMGGGAKQKIIQFMGGRAKQRMIKYRLCGAMIGHNSQGVQKLKRFHAWGGSAPVASNIIIMGHSPPPPRSP